MSAAEADRDYYKGIAKAQAAQLVERDAEIERLKHWQATREADAAVILERCAAAQTLLQQAREGLEDIAKGSEAHRITNGSPGPLFNAGWSGGVNHAAGIARETLSAIQPGDSHEQR